MNSIIHSFPGKMDFASGERLQFASQIFKALKDLNEVGPGISRETYGPGETLAMEYLKDVLDFQALPECYFLQSMLFLFERQDLPL